MEGYGLSETSPVASSGHPGQVRKAGSIGTPIEKVEMRIVDEDGKEVPQGDVGEIVIRGHNIMKGYWDKPEATAEAIRDGWFHSGDMGREDEDGYFYVVDRKKDMNHPRRLQRLSARGRGAALRAPGDPRSGGTRRPPPRVGRGGRRRRGPRTGRRGRPGRRSAPGSASGSPPTSTRASSGSWTSCRRARPARS